MVDVESFQGMLWLNISAMLSLENFVASDFDKVAGTATYYLQYYYMYFLRIIGKVASRSHGSNRQYRRLPPLLDNTINGIFFLQQNLCFISNM